MTESLRSDWIAWGLFSEHVKNVKNVVLLEVCYCLSLCYMEM